jgi:hypothetical protein
MTPAAPKAKPKGKKKAVAKKKAGGEEAPAAE